MTATVRIFTDDELVGRSLIWHRVRCSECGPVGSTYVETIAELMQSEHETKHKLQSASLPVSLGTSTLLAVGGPGVTRADFVQLDEPATCAALFDVHDPECSVQLEVGDAAVMLRDTNEIVSLQCADWGVSERQLDDGRWVTGLLSRPSRPDDEHFVDGSSYARLVEHLDDVEIDDAYSDRDLC